MQLTVRAWGEGPRSAVLVHGVTSDSGTWHRVAPRLARLGYRCLAVDLPGHGRSPRDGYTLAACADALVESVPAGPDLAIGHSLGGLVLTAAVERLRPRAAVYVDPPWQLGGERDTSDPERFRRVPLQRGGDIARENPRWSAGDVHHVLAARSRWDPDAVAILHDARRHGPLLPSSAAVPSLVLRADGSELVSDADAQRLQAAGFEVRTVPGAGHNVFRDDLEGFLEALDGWVEPSRAPEAQG
ncbi:alpha-beta hydrolase superfamily lysophospholipase [Kineococcus xinjiangensis]|uniref:Alpha-beta hydrolase superfamily lysophospholipase n=1 Tax=Kineococcus xinjiangensis TaxID=512762 RepID=A0A2S6ITQ8_9ACTN|nr:alpha/beta hydrolase [Kineococcus xinjiangensis]PPK97637.1 alpha-beta hydrolase superfamily lysophospholipase [Kineococcus xinjiangensis]